MLKLDSEFRTPSVSFFAFSGISWPVDAERVAVAAEDVLVGHVHRREVSGVGLYMRRSRPQAALLYCN
jgi:hypothetical protein